MEFWRRTAIVIVKPETVIAGPWQRFRLFWTWKSRRRAGRPTVPADDRAAIRTLSATNPLWGAPRIHGELLKLGIEVSQSSVAMEIQEVNGATCTMAKRLTLNDLSDQSDASASTTSSFWAQPAGATY